MSLKQDLIVNILESLKEASQNQKFMNLYLVYLKAKLTEH